MSLTNMNAPKEFVLRDVILPDVLRGGNSTKTASQTKHIYCTLYSVQCTVSLARINLIM